MIKIKNLQYRSIWYKKNFYYLKSGQSLSSSTRISASCQETIQIHQEIDGGFKLSDTIKDETLNRYFQSTEISLIKIAENTSNMDNVFLLLSQLLKDQHEQKQKVINAFIYPLLILFMALFLFLTILLIIVPKITPLFEDLKTLPISTKIIIFLSKHLIRFWYIDLLFIFTSIISYISIRNNKTLIYFKDKFINFVLFNTLYIRDIFLFWHIERWLKIVHISLNSGVTISDSLRFAFESINNKYLQKQFEKIYINVDKGNTVSRSIELLDKRVYMKLRDWQSIIDSGEKTGRFSEVFEICHINIRENLNNNFERFQKMIEPILIIFVGVMVMTICISIMLPMYQLTQSIQ